MKKKTSSNKLVLYNTLSTIILYAITFFSVPIFSRLLGTENYGIVQVYNTWVDFFSIIVGLFTRGTLAIAKVKYDEKKYAEYQSSVLGLSVVAFFAVFVLVMLFKTPLIHFFGLGTKYLVIMLFHSFGTYCVFFINTKFTYEMKAFENLIISVVIAIANFLLSYIFIILSTNTNLYMGRIIGMAIPYCVMGIYVLIYIFGEGRVFYNREYWSFCLPLCIPLIFHGLSGIICASSDRIMLQQMSGLKSVGIYTLAYNFANIMMSIWGALNNSWVPFFTDYIKENKYDLLRKKSKSYIRLFTCLSIGFILLSPDVFYLFASKEYWEGGTIIPIVVLSTYAIFIYALASNYEFCFKRTDMIAIGSMIAGGANILLNVIFIELFDFIGAAIATLFSNIILAIVHIVFAKKLVKDKWVYSIKMFAYPIISVLIATVLYYICFEYWVIRWCLAIIVGIYMLRSIYIQKEIF